MLLPRASSLRSSLRPSFNRSGRLFQMTERQTWQRLAQRTPRRSYASATESAKKTASSDLPWLLGSVAVTIPGTWWVLSSHDKGNHPHGGYGTKQQEEQEPAKEQAEEIGGEAVQEVAEKKGNPSAKASAKREKEAFGEGEEKEEPRETPENKGDTEGVDFKGKTKSDAPDDHRKLESTGQGANKLRIDSGQGENLGANDSVREGETGSKADAGPVKNQMSDKQSGVSTSDTRHSVDIQSDPKKSSKGEGAPETAKVKGSVDPARPQADNKEARDSSKT
ncbi:hypothetical protein M501DRAFT_450592 [Patellaria atrata CBS 101060]|uniref:Uncharacterized protein n=1 Tax=Patellaria atrata CBS 101060 TaxID=1346257 RepID=A0A9P4VMN6_9PEZI|nr:hypothetical protein M501DRAFT_450592 [Patellaria atrata CBS 101060]